MAKRKVKRPRATVADLLGHRSPRPRVPRKWQEAYDRLVKLRDQLYRQQLSLAQDAEPPLQHTGIHMADAGTDASEQDLALGLISFDRETVHQIDQAIERIRNGSYGICELTGKPIRADRLKAVPWARFSAKAEKQLESEGVGRRVVAGRRSQSSPPGTDSEDGADSDSE